MGYFYAKFLSWLLKAYPETKKEVDKAVKVWCAKHEVNYFAQLTDEEKITALLDGMVQININNYDIEHLLSYYEDKFDSTVLENIASSIQLAKWLGEFTAAIDQSNVTNYND